jgi:hypothetical protein
MSLNRKTRIGVIGLSGLLAAAVSVGLAATAAAATLAPAMEERFTALGFEAGALAVLDESRLAEIAALLEAEHDDETLTRELGAILEGDTDAAG